MNAPPLVVVTRPQGRAENILAQCQSAGWQVCHIPLLRLAANDAMTDDLNALLQTADAVFFVSPSTVEFAAPQTDWAAFQGKVVAVGAATAAALHAVTGREVLYPQEDNDSEAVLRLPLWQEARGKLLIVRGAGGRELLAQTLRERGWQVDIAEIYRRIPQTVSAAEQELIFTHHGKTAVIITSAEAAQIWLQSIAPQYSTLSKRLLYFTIHPRIENVLRAAGMEYIESYRTGNEIIAALFRRWG